MVAFADSKIDGLLSSVAILVFLVYAAGPSMDYLVGTVYVKTVFWCLASVQ